jgi:hypothetical protein
MKKKYQVVTILDQLYNVEANSKEEAQEFVDDNIDELGLIDGIFEVIEVVRIR